MLDFLRVFFGKARKGRSRP